MKRRNNGNSKRKKNSSYCSCLAFSNFPSPSYSYYGILSSKAFRLILNFFFLKIDLYEKLLALRFYILDIKFVESYYLQSAGGITQTLRLDNRSSISNTQIFTIISNLVHFSLDDLIFVQYGSVFIYRKKKRITRI
jgi:hypothetical protein